MKNIIGEGTGISLVVVITLLGLAFSAGKSHKDIDFLVSRVSAIESDRALRSSDYQTWKGSVTTDIAVMKVKIDYMVPDAKVQPQLDRLKSDR